MREKKCPPCSRVDENSSLLKGQKWDIEPTFLFHWTLYTNKINRFYKICKYSLLAQQAKKNHIAGIRKHNQILYRQKNVLSGGFYASRECIEIIWLFWFMHITFECAMCTAKTTIFPSLLALLLLTSRCLCAVLLWNQHEKLFYHPISFDTVLLVFCHSLPFTIRRCQISNGCGSVQFIAIRPVYICSM